MKPFSFPERSRCQGGAAVIEFAIMLPLLLLLIAGMAEFGRVIWYYDALAKATRDSARSLSLVTQTNWADATVRATALTAAQTLVIDAATAANIPGLTSTNVQVQCDSGGGFAACGSPPPTYVRVMIVNYTVAIGQLFPILTADRNAWSVTDVNLRPFSVMPYMQ
jgi:Flp pilus assembly protein TadG